MARILFIADIHIKLGQKNVPVDWAKNRYYEFIAQMTTASRGQDYIILGGDIFDRVPTLEELAIYFDLIQACEIPTYIYDGNHEASKKGKTFFSYLKSHTHSLNSLVRVVDHSDVWEDFSILPYCELHKYKTLDFPTDRPLFTHVRGEIPPHVKPEIDLSIFDKYPVVFAGDLHSHSNTQRNIVYPGSPMTTSFHRNEVDTGYLLIDGLNWTWHKFKLPQLIRKTVNDPSEMIPTSYHHTVYELEGDAVSLSKVRNTDLLDKKLIKKASEATLVLNPKMSMVEELVEYLRYVLELPDSSIEEIVKVYNDYS